MNDSFLEDFELVQKITAPVNHLHGNERNITTRKVLSPPKFVLGEHDKLNLLPQEKIISASNIPKAKLERRSGNTEYKRRSAPDAKPPGSTPNSTDKKSKTQTKERRSGNLASSCGSDGSAKENSKPTDLSRETIPQEPIREPNRQSSSTSKKSDVIEKSDPVNLLNAIKEIVKLYSEQEVGKILKSMHELHLNSQVNLIRHLMLQSSELISEINSKNAPSKIQELVEENETLREDILILQTRNNELQKKVNEAVLIREENISLKLKLKELQK